MAYHPEHAKVAHALENVDPCNRLCLSVKGIGGCRCQDLLSTGSAQPLFGFCSFPDKPTTFEVSWIDENYMLKINPTGLLTESLQEAGC